MKPAKSHKRHKRGGKKVGAWFKENIWEKGLKPIGKKIETAVNTVYSDVRGTVDKGFGVVDKGFGMMNKVVLIGGVLVGGVVLYGLMNPNQTERIATSAINTAGSVAEKAAPLAML